MRVLEGGRISIAAVCLGLAEEALELATGYAARREQFGRPIAEFQAIQWMLADTATELAAARLLTMQAAAAEDAPDAAAGERVPGGAYSRTQASSMAKLFASEMATRAASRALQIHGGYGYLRGEYAIERILRDARFFEIGEGTSEIQRLIIARSLLKG
jgi:alkylation response protein AidB-like acyl-CoA dehydrogenase